MFPWQTESRAKASVWRLVFADATRGKEGGGKKRRETNLPPPRQRERKGGGLQQCEQQTPVACWQTRKRRRHKKSEPNTTLPYPAHNKPQRPKVKSTSLLGQLATTSATCAECVSLTDLSFLCSRQSGLVVHVPSGNEVGENKSQCD